MSTTHSNTLAPAGPAMWWDGGERAITAREKARIEEHGPSCFSIALVPATPSARWAADALADPHGDRYACERAALTLGNLTDDELANAVFLHGNEQPTMADLAAGKALAGIVYLTAAKDRIRWLSRALGDAIAPQPAELAEQQGDHVPDAILRCAIRAFERARKDYKLRLCNEEPQGKKEAIEALSMEAALQAAFALAATGKQQVGEAVDMATLDQILLDPENQPSQFGTVPTGLLEHCEEMISDLVHQFGDRGCTCTFPEDDCCAYARAEHYARNPKLVQQPAQGIDLGRVKRYALDDGFDRHRGVETDKGAHLYEHDDGDWVKWDDVEALIDQRDAAPGVGNG
ncbi:hypothetical protein [Stenotrophomonas bentonitica]